jgi:ribonuclease P protein component
VAFFIVLLIIKEYKMRKIRTLKKNYEFKYVLSKGKYYRGKYITIYIKESLKNVNTIGIAVNTKAGKAVKRNHAKRLIRENYRLIKNDLSQGFNIVFLLNKNVEINKLDFFDIQKDMIDIFNKANLFVKR